MVRDALARTKSPDGTVKRTSYCPSCSGTHCADGSPVRPGICATDPKLIPTHSWIWVEGDGLLYATDTGGAVKGGVVDVWLPRCVGDCWKGPGTRHGQGYVILKRGPAPKSKPKRHRRHR